MRAVFKALLVQAQLSLVNERSGLERLPWLLAGRLRAGELAQLGIDEREQFLPSPGIAVLDRGEEPGD